jgi:hypothetical protein
MEAMQHATGLTFVLTHFNFIFTREWEHGSKS